MPIRNKCYSKVTETVFNYVPLSRLVPLMKDNFVKISPANDARVKSS